MSGVMMLNWLAERRAAPRFRDCASRIRVAYDRALIEGATTADLGGKLSTMAFADAIIARM